MKPHLPVSLFRALIAAAIAFPMFAFGGEADVPSNYQKKTVTTANQVNGNQGNLAFLLQPDSLSTVNNPTMSWGSSAPLIFNSSEVNVLLTSWDNNNLCSIDMSYGQHLMTVGDLTFTSLYDITLDSNKYGTSPEVTTTLSGGTLASGSLTHDEDGNLEGYDTPDGEILFGNNHNINLTRNELSLKVTSASRPVQAYGFGGVIMAPTTTISGNKIVTLDANTLKVEAGTQNGSNAVGKGGLIYGTSISIRNNESVSIKSNRLDVTSSGTISAALGAAMFSNREVTITGNDSVTIRDNAIHYKTSVRELFYLQSIAIDSKNGGKLTLSAGSNCGVNIYDPIVVDCNVSINETFTNTQGREETAVGDVVFSAKYAEDDLKAYLKAMRGAGNETPSATELMLSTTSVVTGLTTLHAGSMRLSDGTTYAGSGFTAQSGSTLYMSSSTLLGGMSDQMLLNFIDIIPGQMLPPHGDGNTVFQAGSNLYLKGVGSTINSAATTFEGNNLITFDISASNLTAAGITIADDLTFNAGTSIYITSANQLTEGIYELINMPDDVEIIGWSSANVTVSSNDDTGFSATYANLRWETDENGIRHLYYYTTMPPLLDALWTNGDGDGVWSSTAINWEQMGQAYAFSNGATATFTDTGHKGNGRVYLKGELRPSEVLVDNSSAAPYEWLADTTGGKLAGDMILTKRGTGSLTISLANTYTGGTIAEEGSLIAGHEQAFGTGNITVRGGDLDMRDFAATNSVLLNYGSFSGTAYAGELTVNGTATIGDNTTAASVTLESAVISGGSITNTDITSKNTTISTQLTGKTNLTSLSNTTLIGHHTSTGLFTVEEGSFTLQGSTTADWNLKGGSLSTEDKITLVEGQDMAFSGGNVLGSIETSANSTISTHVSSSISDSLTFNGGVFTPGGKGVELNVGGALNILSQTEVDVRAYVNSDTYVLINATSITGDVNLLTPLTDTRNVNTLEVRGSSLILNVQENAATLYWAPDASGQWQQLGSQEWVTEAADNRFYNRDNVIFDQGGRVEIIGEVKPNSIVVDGSKDVSMIGSGSIVGQTSLVKKGSNSLYLNAVNKYEEGTIIEDGTVYAGGEQSFGSGEILLQKGHLDMGIYAVTNDVTATGGKFSGTAYSGTLYVEGDINVGDNTTAKKVELASGSIKEGSLRDTEIVTSGPALIESELEGTTSLSVEDSETILNCKNTSTGQTKVNGGVLNIAHDEALGAGDIYLNAGSMKATNGITLALSGKQKLYFRGGSVSGNLTTGNSSSIVVDRDAHVDGTLKFNGGTVYFNGEKKDNEPAARSMIMKSNGCTLYVTDSLTLTADTMIQLEKGQYADGDILIEAGSLTGDFSKLILNYDDGNPNTEYTLALQETEDKVQILLDLDKVYEHTSGKWTLANADLRDLLVQSNWGMLASSHAFTDALQGQRSASGTVGSKGVMIWASGLYSHMSINDDGGMYGGDSDTTGIAVGLETMLGHSSCIGFAVGVTSSDISVGNLADKMEQDATYIGIYGATVLKRLSETSGLTLSWSAAYGSVASSPSGAASSIEWNQDSFQLNGRIDWSRALNDTTTVNLFAGLEYFMTTSDEVAGADSGEIRNLRAELGAGITRRYAATVLYAEARVLGDIMRDDPTPTINGWSEEGANPGTVGAGFRVGAAYDINQFWSISANGSVEIMGDAVNAGAAVGASLRF